MARTPRTFSRRGRAQAKAGKNIGQDKPRKDVTEKAIQIIQREAISEVSLTRSPSRFVGVLRLPRLRTTRFHGRGLPDDRTWREGVFSLKHRRCNETNQYHPAQQPPHENDWLPWNENVHGRPPGTKSGSLSAIILRKPRHFFVKIQNRVSGTERRSRTYPLLYDGDAPPTLGNLPERIWQKSVAA
jgi:hypothetical protein